MTQEYWFEEGCFITELSNTPDCRQRIANAGSGDLIFLAICTPRFVKAAYEDLG